MNTKMKQIALPLVVVIAVLLAFSSPAAATYAGDHPLTTYEQGMINDGGMVYEAVTDGSGYAPLNAIESATYSQDITITIPEGATVKLARLYNYYTWSSSDLYITTNPGIPAEATIGFTDLNGVTQKKECIHGYHDGQIGSIPNPIYYGTDAVQYWDSKGQGYDPAIVGSYAKKYDFPSGTFAWDVTSMVTGSGIYTATIMNADSSSTPGEYFRTFGFGLLVVYENADEIDNELEYWIAEGCDYLMARKYEKPKDATTRATFEDKELKENEGILTTVVTASDKGLLKPPQNRVLFNSQKKGPSTAQDKESIGVNDFDVKLNKMVNIAEFQDRDDCEVVCNAFLVVEKVEDHE